MKRAYFSVGILLTLWIVGLFAIQDAFPSKHTKQLQVFNGDGTIALKGAIVIDGTGTRPRPAALIVIVKDRLAYVGDAAGVQLGPCVKVMNMAGRWIIPGFIDAHVHLPDEWGVASFLTQLLAFGTTTIRVAAYGRVELREFIADGTELGPRLFVAGALIDGLESEFSGALKVGTEAEVRDVVRQQAEERFDFIKLYVGLTPNLVRAAIVEAHRLGLPVMGHLGKTTWAEAANAGIDSLAHSWYAGLAHSIVPSQYQAEFRDFYVPNRLFNPALFRKWREVVNLNGPEVAQLTSLLRERHVEVHPNLVLGEAMTWKDDPAVLERLELTCS